jgi:chitinase
MFRNFVRLKKTNTDLKVLVAVGGWTAGSKQFSDLVHSDTMRHSFVASSVKFLQKYGFDGLGWSFKSFQKQYPKIWIIKDLDWEYPASYDGSKPTDKQYFSKLIQVSSLRIFFQTTTDHPYEPECI